MRARKMPAVSRGGGIRFRSVICTGVKRALRVGTTLLASVAMLTAGTAFAVDEDMSETKLAEKDITINSPTEMVIIVPAGLEDGTYTLTITTQYVKGSKLLKTPRSVSTTVYVGSASPGGNDDEEEDGPQVQ